MIYNAILQDDAVDGLGDGIVQLADVQAGIAKRDVAGELIAPALDFLQEFVVNVGRTALALCLRCEFVESAFEDRLLGKPGPDFTFVVGH